MGSEPKRCQSSRDRSMAATLVHRRSQRHGGDGRVCQRPTKRSTAAQRVAVKWWQADWAAGGAGHGCGAVQAEGFYGNGAWTGNQ